MASEALGVVYYRFVHETDESFKRLEFQGTSIMAGDMKILVAKSSGLEKEFARKFDLKLFTAASSPQSSTLNATTTELTEIASDLTMIPVMSRIVIQRVLWQQKPVIEHVASVDQPAPCLTAAATGTPQKRVLRPFPPEYLCPLCSSVLLHPVVVRCSSKCGLSACRKCVQDKLNAKRVCPFCEGRVQSVIANKALAAIVSRLDLAEFDVPKLEENTLQSSDTKVSSSFATLANSSSAHASNVLPSSSSGSQASGVGDALPDLSLPLKEEVASIAAVHSEVQMGTASASFRSSNFQASLVTTIPSQKSQSHEKDVVSAVKDENPCSALPLAPSVLTNKEALSGSEDVQLQRLLSAATPLLKNLSSTLAKLAFQPETEKNSLSMAASSATSPQHTVFPSNASEPTSLKRSSASPTTASIAGSPDAVPLRAIQRSNKFLKASRQDVPRSAPSSAAPVVATATSGGYEFDPVTNSWRPVKTASSTQLNPTEPPITDSTLHPSVVVPFTSIGQLASRFPRLSRKDFFILRQFQRELAVAINVLRQPPHGSTRAAVMNHAFPESSIYHLPSQGNTQAAFSFQSSPSDAFIPYKISSTPEQIHHATLPPPPYTVHLGTASHYAADPRYPPESRFPTAAPKSNITLGNRSFHKYSSYYTGLTSPPAPQPVPYPAFSSYDVPATNY